jgi:hypothetical protein
MQIATTQADKGDFLMSDEIIRERDFFRAKLQEAISRVKVLEGDNADLQKRDADVTKRLNELSNQNNTNYRPRYRQRSN